jgi:hypothetical protein
MRCSMAFFNSRTALLLLLGLPAACGSDNGGGGSADARDGNGSTDAAAAIDSSSAADRTGSNDGTGLQDHPNGGDAGASTPAVNLGMAGTYAILAKTGVSTVPASAITGNVGVSPAAATYITGLSLIADSTNVFSGSPQVTGKIFASDYAPPTPANLTTAVADMLLGFTDAAGRAPRVSELGAGNIGGMTLAPGVYKWGTGVLIPTDITLNGSATAVWIFQIAQDLTVSNGVRVALAGGALPKNVFWQVAGLVDLGTTAHLEGTILGQTSITLHTGASINGRLLAQTAVSLDGSTVVEPTP